MTHVLDPAPIVVSVLSNVTKAQINTALTKCDRLLTSLKTRIPLELSREWTRRFPKDAGVYAVFDKGKLIYLGETGSLCARMADFLNSRHHTLRRSLGNARFKKIKGFEEASTKKPFPNHVEKLVTDYIELHLTVTAVIVQFGRKEIEENLISKYRPRYNTKGKRVTKLLGSSVKGHSA